MNHDPNGLGTCGDSLSGLEKLFQHLVNIVYATSKAGLLGQLHELGLKGVHGDIRYLDTLCGLWLEGSSDRGFDLYQGETQESESRFPDAFGHIDDILGVKRDRLSSDEQ